MTTTVFGGLEKKNGSKINSHHSPFSPHPHTKKTPSYSNLTGTNLSVEIIEVKENNNKLQLVGGPFQCILEVTDPTIHQTVWKQKSSAQFTNKPPIMFGDIFKVKNFSGDWGVDIKPGYVLKVQFCKVEEKGLSQLGITSYPLDTLVVNKEQQLTLQTVEETAEIVMRLNLSNPAYPRGVALTLSEISQKEKEKEVEKEKQGTPLIQRTTSYTLPRVNVRFHIHYHTVPGEEIRIVGSNIKLGDWEVSKAPALDWAHGGIWTKEIGFRTVYLPFEYKYVVHNVHTGATRWESVTSNRKFESTDTTDTIDRYDVWDKL